MPIDALELVAGEEKSTLDLPERQVLVNFPDDVDYQWHHLLLLLRGGAGKWFVGDPYGQVRLLDPTAMLVVPLDRDAPFPDADRPHLIFSSEDFGETNAAFFARQGCHAARSAR